MTDQPKEWQCGYCNHWVDGAWGRHVHVTQVEPTLEEMKAARERGVDFAAAQDIHTYMRTGDEPTREKPL